MQYALMHVAEPLSEPLLPEWAVVFNADDCNEAFDKAHEEHPAWMTTSGNRTYFYSDKGRPLVILEKQDSKIHQIHPALSDFPEISIDILQCLEKQG